MDRIDPATLAALVQAGQLDGQTAGLLAMAGNRNDPTARPAEAALRQIERRIAAKFLAYMRGLAARMTTEEADGAQQAADDGADRHD